MWNNRDDLDIHVITPSGEEISYANKNSKCGGKLDVDANASGNTTEPVENVYWALNSAPKGNYKVVIENFNYHEPTHGEIKFKVQVVLNGKSTMYSGLTSGIKRDSRVVCCEFDYQGQPETDQMTEMLQNAWAEDPLDTLKIIFQMRDCRGGKGEKKPFFKCLQWLITAHPEAVEKNMEHIPFFGYWKDLLFFQGTTFENLACQVFAKQLKDDLKALEDAKGDESGKTKASISLAAKWAPTERHKQKQFAKKLAKVLFPKSKKQLAEYRRVYLVPLRAYLDVIEVKMCKQAWDVISYAKVPSRSMSLYKKAFSKHDQDRFGKFLEDVKSGKTTIKAQQMMPHELVLPYVDGGDKDDVTELQWKALIDSALKKGSLKSSIVICDISHQMSSIAKAASFGLSLLISSVTAPPFKDFVVTFSKTPTMSLIKGDSLKEKIVDLLKLKSDNGCDFPAVFDMILSKLVAAKMPADAVPKNMICLCRMNFQAADAAGKTWAQSHKEIAKKYTDAGYEMPQLIFWNVDAAASTTFPVETHDTGILLVSGFDTSVVKLLMDDGEIKMDTKGGKPDAFFLVRKAIDDPRYNVLTL